MKRNIQKDKHMEPKSAGIALSLDMLQPNGITPPVERSVIITKNEAIEIGTKVASLIRAQLDKDAKVFIFGSTVTGKAHVRSDIDVAVVSKMYDHDMVRAGAKISQLARKIDPDIEIHDIHPTDWKNGDPHVLEVQKWGIEV
jgi:predicted nucleotidyltransferase